MDISNEMRAFHCNSTEMHAFQREMRERPLPAIVILWFLSFCFFHSSFYIFFPFPFFSYFVNFSIFFLSSSSSIFTYSFLSFISFFLFLRFIYLFIHLMPRNPLKPSTVKPVFYGHRVLQPPDAICQNLQY